MMAREYEQTPIRAVSFDHREYFCGCAAGATKIGAWHFLDSVKGRVQSGLYETPLQAFRGTIKNEGVLALWKGVLFPVSSVGVVSGLLFFVNGSVRRFIQPPSVDGSANRDLNFCEMLFAGSAGGAAVGAVLTPFETMKIQRQLRQDCAGVKEIVGKLTFRELLQQGGVRGLNAGWWPTFAREVLTFGIFFAVGESLMNVARHSLNTKNNKTDSGTASFSTAAAGGAVKYENNDTLPVSLRILCSGTGGVMGWIPAFPFDQVKTAVQATAFLPDPAKRLTPTAAARQLYAEGGAKRFFTGISPCLARAFPALATQDFCYRSFMGYVQRNDKNGNAEA